MTSDGNGNGDSGNGVHEVQCPTMTIVVDPRTGLPSYTCSTAAIAFWQMIVGEVARQLEEQRRMAMMNQIRQAAADEQIRQALLQKR